MQIDVMIQGECRRSVILHKTGRAPTYQDVAAKLFSYRSPSDLPSYWGLVLKRRNQVITLTRPTDEIESDLLVTQQAMLYWVKQENLVKIQQATAKDWPTSHSNPPSVDPFAYPMYMDALLDLTLPPSAEFGDSTNPANPAWVADCSHHADWYLDPSFFDHPNPAPTTSDATPPASLPAPFMPETSGIADLPQLGSLDGSSASHGDELDIGSSWPPDLSHVPANYFMAFRTAGDESTFIPERYAEIQLDGSFRFRTSSPVYTLNELADALALFVSTGVSRIGQADTNEIAKWVEWHCRKPILAGKIRGNDDLYHIIMLLRSP